MNAIYQEPSATVYCGHALDLAELPPESVDMCMTSPPYWGLRSYKTEPQIWDSKDGCRHQWVAAEMRLSNSSSGTGKQATDKGTLGIGTPRTMEQTFCSLCGAWRGELGLEPTIELYIKHLIQIFNEVKRVLKKTGTCWVVIDDSYASGKGTCYNPGGGKGSFSTHGDRKDSGVYPLDRGNISMLRAEGLLPKTLCLIPERFAIAMVESGWILHNKVVWWKLNPMPESSKRRFTTSWEYVFFFSKNNKPVYWVNRRNRRMVGKQPLGVHGIEGEDWEWIEHSACNGQGCGDKRCVNGKVKSSFWSGYDYFFEQQFENVAESTVGRGPVEFGGAKGRNYQPTADDPNYRAGSEQWGRTFDYTESCKNGRNKRDVWEISTQPYPEAHFATYPEKLCEIPILAGCPSMICKKCGKARERIYEGTGHVNKREPAHQPGNTPTKVDSTGWAPTERLTEKYTDCGCNAGFEPGVVVDPFMGRGTTLAVAKKLGRRAIGIDISPNYCKLTVKTLQEIPMAMELVA